MEPKARTLQERMGFRDEELSTPRHDEIMLWLDENAERLFPSGKGLPWPEENIKAQRSDHEKRMKQHYLEMLDDAKFKAQGRVNDMLDIPLIERGLIREKAVKEAQDAVKAPIIGLPEEVPPQDGLIVKTWEKPVLSGNYTVGFIDMEINFRRSKLTWGYSGGSSAQWDVKLYQAGSEDDCKLIEVKPTIRSIGELIRQINTYKTYRPGEYFVCSPDARFESALKSQRIGFIKAEI